MKNLFLLFFGLIVLCFCGQGFRGQVTAEESKPNVLLIVVDDMGYSDLGCFGGEIETPNIDSLAQNGLRFTQFYNTSRCWPTRTGLMTGYYPQQVRSDPVVTDSRLPQGTKLVPHYLKPLGYRCYHSGKWHVPGAPLPCQDGGFDRSYELLDPDRNFYPKGHRLNDQPLPPVNPGDDYYTTTFIAEKTMEQLREHAEKTPDAPFFAFTAFTSPHFPLHAPQEVIDKYRDKYLEGWDKIREERFARLTDAGIVHTTLSPREENVGPPYRADNLAPLGPGEVLRPVAWDSMTEEQKRFQATKMAIHAAMVDCIDQQTGRIITELKRLGMFENTVIFIFSDNGCSAEIMIRGDGHDPEALPGSGKSFLCLGPGWSTASNTPFRRHKVWTLEGGISTSLVVHWPQGIAENARNGLRHDMGHIVDILPTILALTGASGDNESGCPLAGESLLPAISGAGKAPRGDIYFHHDGNRAIRSGDFKAVSTAANRQGDGIWRLFDLSTDRSEQHDLSEQMPEKLAELSQNWEKMTQQFQKDATRP